MGLLEEIFTRKNSLVQFPFPTEGGATIHIKLTTRTCNSQFDNYSGTLVRKSIL